MKEKLMVLVSIIVLCVATGAAVDSYHQKQTDRANASANRRVVDAEKSSQTKARDLEATVEFYKSQANCFKSLATYNGLATADKQKQEKPVCDTELVQ